MFVTDFLFGLSNCKLIFGPQQLGKEGPHQTVIGEQFDNICVFVLKKFLAEFRWDIVSNEEAKRGHWTFPGAICVPISPNWMWTTHCQMMMMMMTVTTMMVKIRMTRRMNWMRMSACGWRNHGSVCVSSAAPRSENGDALPLANYKCPLGQAGWWCRQESVGVRASGS